MQLEDVKKLKNEINWRGKLMLSSAHQFYWNLINNQFRK
jgi:hypothetical protein